MTCCSPCLTLAQLFLFSLLAPQSRVMVPLVSIQCRLAPEMSSYPWASTSLYEGLAHLNPWSSFCSEQSKCYRKILMPSSWMSRSLSNFQTMVIGFPPRISILTRDPCPNSLPTWNQTTRMNLELTSLSTGRVLSKLMTLHGRWNGHLCLKERTNGHGFALHSLRRTLRMLRSRKNARRTYLHGQNTRAILWQTPTSIQEVLPYAWHLLLMLISNPDMAEVTPICSYQLLSIDMWGHNLLSNVWQSQIFSTHELCDMSDLQMQEWLQSLCCPHFCHCYVGRSTILVHYCIECAFLFL